MSYAVWSKYVAKLDEVHWAMLGFINLHITIAEGKLIMRYFQKITIFCKNYIRRAFSKIKLDFSARNVLVCNI